MIKMEMASYFFITVRIFLKRLRFFYDIVKAKDHLLTMHDLGRLRFACNLIEYNALKNDKSFRKRQIKSTYKISEISMWVK